MWWMVRCSPSNSQMTLCSTGTSWRAGRRRTTSCRRTPGLGRIAGCSGFWCTGVNSSRGYHGPGRTAGVPVPCTRSARTASRSWPSTTSDSGTAIGPWAGPATVPLPGTRTGWRNLRLPCPGPGWSPQWPLFLVARHPGIRLHCIPPGSVCGFCAHCKRTVANAVRGDNTCTVCATGSNNGNRGQHRTPWTPCARDRSRRSRRPGCTNGLKY